MNYHLGPSADKITATNWHTYGGKRETQ